MSEPQFTTALHHRLGRQGTLGLTVAMREVGDRGMIDLRGLPSDRRFLPAVKGVLGFDLPRKPRTSAGEGDVAALWLSIDQWLITAPRENAAALAAALTDSLAGIHSLAVDLSDARTIIRLEGESARSVLAKGTSADLWGPDFVQGTVRRLRFAEIAAMVHVVGIDPDALDLYVFRSHADYAWEYLLATARDGSRLTLFGAQNAPRT
jgi:sarcosine oxidase subunit gamma